MLLLIALLASGSAAAWSGEVEQSVRSGHITGLADTLYLQLEDCNGRLPLCLNIPLADSAAYVLSVDGAAYAGDPNPCNEEIFHQFDYQPLPGRGGQSANEQQAIQHYFNRASEVRSNS